LEEKGWRLRKALKRKDPLPSKARGSKFLLHLFLTLTYLINPAFLHKQVFDVKRIKAARIVIAICDHGWYSQANTMMRIAANALQ
jgi:hypothetical protein